MMAGVILILAMLAAAGKPELPAAPSADVQPKRAAKPLASAVDLGAKWGIVTSVRRSPERNRAVGGAENSFHLYGRAVDIARRPGVRHAEIASAYRKAGYILVESLDEGDHSHFAFGLIGEEPRQTPVEATELAAAEPACPAPGEASVNLRRRPDRTDDCAFPEEPKPRLRPLEAAP